MARFLNITFSPIFLIVISAIFGLSSEMIGIFIIIWLATYTYFFPTVVGYSRRHTNNLSIFMLNLFLGWTFLGWVGALVWAAFKG